MHCVEVLPWFVTTGFLLMSLSSAARAGVITSWILNLMQRTRFWVLPFCSLYGAELSCDRSLNIQYREKSLSAFWLSVSTEYPLLSNRAVNILLPFATTYLCETAFFRTHKYEDEVQIQGCRWKWCVYVYPTLRQELTVCAKWSKHIHHTNIVCLPFNPL